MSTRLSSRRTVAHAGRPVGHRLRRAGERAVLRDGSDALIRPVRHDDAALLAGGFDRLSAQSRRFRFLTAKNFLSPSELRYLTEIDHHDHEALGARSTPSTDAGLASPATSAPPTTRRPPRSRSSSSTSGRAAGSGPSC